MRTISVSFALAAGLVAGCVGFGSDESPVSSTVATARLSGAIFTTLVDGSRVDANIYHAKEDVYLDGGPGNGAPQKAAALPDGDYFFQVTDPSGKILLSSDAIQCRRVQILEGIIVQAYAGTCGHMMGADQDHGAVTVQLMPYDDTPNPGGEYKVWMTPVGSYDAEKGKHGFIESDSKTDNYKVRVPEVAPPPPPPTPCCGDGHVDSGEQCDDGNTTSGDGCSSTCTTEQPPPPPPPTPCCGDGTVDNGEQCDDGNTADGDGCSSTCQTETPPPPPPCECGNGVVEDGETCDDGNMTDGDGCSSTCQTEATCPPTP